LKISPATGVSLPQGTKKFHWKFLILPGFSFQPLAKRESEVQYNNYVPRRYKLSATAETLITIFERFILS